MNVSKVCITACAAIACAGYSASAAMTYSGNGNTSFGGGVGLSSLVLSDDGTTVSGALTTAAPLYGNALVIYIQAGAGGITSTAGLNDNSDQLRTAISENNGPGNQSILNFSGGFAPNYAIALAPAGGVNFGGIWGLASGTLPYDGSANLTPTGGDGPGLYNFSFNVSQLGLTPGAGQSFEFLGLEVSTTGYSSAEALGGNVTGSLGYGGLQTATSFSTYTVVPEPASLAMMAGGLAALVGLRRRR